MRYQDGDDVANHIGDMISILHDITADIETIENVPVEIEDAMLRVVDAVLNLSDTLSIASLNEYLEVE